MATQTLVLATLRECLYKWAEAPGDLTCPLLSCDFETNGPKYGGSGFVTLEMYLHLLNHSDKELGGI